MGGAMEVTKDELTGLRQEFEACDADGDGWIRSPEFEALLKQLDHELTSDECLLAFDMTDADGDGLISFEEFMGWWSGE